MQLNHLAMVAIDHVFGRLLRRSLFALAIAAFAAVAIYQGTVAGILALQVHYNEMTAHLIVTAVYAALTLIGFVIFWATGTKSASAPALSVPPELQLAMLVEAAMLGYSLAKKGERAP